MRNLNKINIHRILALSVIFISFILITGLNNTNFTSFGTNVNNDINSKEKLKSNDLSTDNDLEGNGAPWNVTHYANRTKSDLAVSFNNNSFNDDQQIKLDSGWMGYQLNSTIKNLYITRNLVNGTFHGGTDNGYSRYDDD
ncbi:MAG: hypothetical protein P8Y23_05545, partial [Candidatus Lokiarchaeota archaeon]